MNAKQEIAEYAKNCSQTFGWGLQRSIDHIVATHPHLARQAAAEDILRDPVKSRGYDLMVKGGSARFYDAAAELSNKARDYARQHGVDFKSGVKAVLAEDKTLARSWHHPDRLPQATTTRRYESGSGPYQGLGSLIANSLNRGVDAAVEVANSNPQLSIGAAQEWLLRESKKQSQNAGLPGLASQAEALGRSQVLNEHPEIRPTLARGVVSSEALRTMYPQFFKDLI